MAVCPVCGMSNPKLEKSRNYKEHLESHNGETIFCSKCGKIFKTTRSFYLHTQHVHKQSKQSCTECTQVFSEQSNLESHIESVHRGETFMCEKCPKKFNWDQNLKTHVKACHGETYACKYENCYKVFGNSRNLNVHIKTHESQIVNKEFTFSQCTMICSTKYRMQLHMRKFHNENSNELSCVCEISINH